MADLITHCLCGYLLYLAAPTRRHSLWFVAGNALPDLVSRLPAQGTYALSVVTGVEVPDPVYLGWDVLHNPFPYLLLCLWLALLAPASSRALLFRSLLLGGWLHVGVDVLQRHMGGAYRLGYPFTLTMWEAGLFWTEDSIYSIPVLVPLAMVGGWWRARRGLNR